MLVPRPLRSLACGLALVVLSCTSAADPGTDAGSGDGGPVIPCGSRDDPDGDSIADAHEGDGDLDEDQVPNGLDPDADGDGLGDRDEAGDLDCLTSPRDLDGDGTPDFLDRDSNDDGLGDDAQRSRDDDDDGEPDWRDLDVDGDGIPNDVERGDGSDPRDSDGDGTPDVRDVDSDGDAITDRHEGVADPDRDDVPTYLDLDSDSDGWTDREEAGDEDLSTAPRTCAAEERPDGLADFVDPDRDDDGLGDGEERELGTDPCALDSDGDGFDDLAEGAYERLNCVRGTEPECGCARSRSCIIPARHFYVVLPYLAPPVQRDLEFGTEIRVADVFFLTDTTGSMESTLENVQESVAGAEGIVERVRATIPDAWFGGGQFDDFPFTPYGVSSLDQVFQRAIVMTPAERVADVQAAFRAMRMHGGNDPPESSTEALYQLLTGEGGTWTRAGARYSLRRDVADCLDGRWGAACFRAGALPIVVHFTDICSHQGPPGESAACEVYEGIDPAPATWAAMVARMNERGAKLVGVSASATNLGCAFAGDEPPEPYGRGPCHFLRRTALATGSVDLDGRPLVFDLPNGATDRASFVRTVSEAIETVATRVPFDIDTIVRDEPSDATDARPFVRGREPACRAPGVSSCWVPPEGIDPARAVAGYDAATFFAVVPGTRVTFRVTFQNDFLRGASRAQIFVAFIDVRGGGAAILDTRQVLVVVPADPTGGLE